MISLTLHPIIPATRDDDTHTESVYERGMAQGGPLSPPLFNLFMDLYSEVMERTGNAPKKEDTTTVRRDVDPIGELFIFGDEPKLQTNTRGCIQKIRDASMYSAEQYGSKWSAVKCIILEKAEEDVPSPLMLAEERLTSCQETKYVGMKVVHNEVGTQETLDRVERAIMKSKALIAAGYATVA